MVDAIDNMGDRSIVRESGKVDNLQVAPSANAIINGIVLRVNIEKGAYPV